MLYIYCCEFRHHYEFSLFKLFEILAWIIRSDGLDTNNNNQLINKKLIKKEEKKAIDEKITDCPSD